MIDLLESEVEIAKISNYQGSALAGDVYAPKRRMSVPKSPKKFQVLEK